MKDSQILTPKIEIIARLARFFEITKMKEKAKKGPKRNNKSSCRSRSWSQQGVECICDAQQLQHHQRKKHKRLGRRRLYAVLSF